MDVSSEGQQRVVRWVAVTAGPAMTLYLGFILFANADAVASALGRLRWWWVAAALLLNLAAYGVRALRWHYYLHRLEVDVNHRLTILLYFAGLSMLITPAMISGVAKLGLVKARIGAELVRTLPVVVVERITDLVAMVILAMVGVFFFGVGYRSMAGAIIFLAVVVALVEIPGCREIFLKTAARLPGIRRYMKYMQRLMRSASILLDARALGAGSIYSLLSWGLVGLAMFLLTEGLNLHLSLPEALFISAFPAILGIMSQMPGGLGVEEGTMISLLLHKGVGLAEATTVVLLFRLVTLWFGLGMGLVALALFSHETPSSPKSVSSRSPPKNFPSACDRSPAGSRVGEDRMGKRRGRI